MEESWWRLFWVLGGEIDPEALGNFCDEGAMLWWGVGLPLGEFAGERGVFVLG